MIREYDFCFECGDVVKISDETLDIMDRLGLSHSDFKFRCQNCKNIDYNNLVKFSDTLKWM